MLSSVVNGDRMTDHFGEDGGMFAGCLEGFQFPLKPTGTSGVKPMEKQIDICATCVHDEPGYCSVIGTIPHCCSRHWHCEPGKAAKDYVPKQEEGETDGKG